jgi:hypothetical protein
MFWVTQGMEAHGCRGCFDAARAEREMVGLLPCGLPSSPLVASPINVVSQLHC